MANPSLHEVEYLSNKNQKLLQHVEDLRAIVLKFTNRRKTLDLLLDSQNFINDKRGIFLIIVLHILKIQTLLIVFLYPIRVAIQNQVLYVIIVASLSIYLLHALIRLTQTQSQWVRKRTSKALFFLYL